jgi:tetrapyrrole methylase family protein / MazG family protein
MAAADHDAISPRPEHPAALTEHMMQLLAVIDRLRSPQGCPWDRKQTPQSMIPYLLEETYEVIESIEDDNPQGLREELGDVLLHIIFQSCMAREAGHFNLDDSVRTITEKLVRRHPHVFGEETVTNAAEVPRNWEAAKQREKGRTSLLDGVPRSLPALARAQRLQEKAAAVGFDWPDIAPVWDKLHEEIEELRVACTKAQQDAIAEEFGDVLFSLVNLSRFLHLNAESSLRQAMAKFEHRFRGIEQELARRGQCLQDASLEEMDAIWNRFRPSVQNRNQKDDPHV